MSGIHSPLQSSLAADRALYPSSYKYTGRPFKQALFSTKIFNNVKELYPEWEDEFKKIFQTDSPSLNEFVLITQFFKPTLEESLSTFHQRMMEIVVDYCKMKATNDLNVLPPPYERLLQFILHGNSALQQDQLYSLPCEDMTYKIYNTGREFLEWFYDIKTTAEEVKERLDTMPNSMMYKNGYALLLRFPKQSKQFRQNDIDSSIPYFHKELDKIFPHKMPKDYKLIFQFFKPTYEESINELEKVVKEIFNWCKNSCDNHRSCDLNTTLLHDYFDDGYRPEHARRPEYAMFFWFVLNKHPYEPTDIIPCAGETQGYVYLVYNAAKYFLDWFYDINTTMELIKQGAEQFPDMANFMYRLGYNLMLITQQKHEQESYGGSFKRKKQQNRKAKRSRRYKQRRQSLRNY